MEGSQPIRVRIITPEKTEYDEMVNHAMLPGIEGNAGIFHKHTPFMTYLKPGYLYIYMQGKRIVRIGMKSAILEFKDDSLTILTSDEIYQEDFYTGQADQSNEQDNVSQK
ncbi:F0F1 ATP synthase subunit epsilon [bacterium]|nr:F0F1 ATP synthase subunit epsilon [bacterium]